MLFNESLACNLTEVPEIDSKEAWKIGLLVGYGKRGGSEEWLVWSSGEFKSFKVGKNEYCSEMVAVYQVPNGYDNTTLAHSKKTSRTHFAAETCGYYVTENVCLYNCPSEYKYVNKGRCSYSCTTSYFVCDEDMDQCKCVESCSSGYFHIYRPAQAKFECVKSCPDEMFKIEQNRTCVNDCAGEYPYENTLSGSKICVSRCSSGFYFVNETRRICQSSCSPSDLVWYNTSFSD